MQCWYRYAVLFVSIIVVFTELDFAYKLNNRVLLSKPLSCDKLPEEIGCPQQILARERSLGAYIRFEHQISQGT